LGRAVLMALGARGVAGVCPRDAANDAIQIDDNGVVDPSALAGVVAIVNCAGLVVGMPGAIERANVTYPTTLARRARAAGVQRFIQVSSFSIYGRTERIDAATLIAPVGDYGRSKLEAEQALFTLDRPDFRVAALRLPFMFSVEEPALLGRLVAMMLRLRMLPTLAKKPSRRSMITYAGAADTLLGLTTAAVLPAGILTAADSEPLELLTVARLIGERVGRRVAIVPIPEALLPVASKAFPTVVDRVFRSSVLAPSANLLRDAGEHGVEATLIRYLDELVVGRSAGQHRGS
jgi:nucleoside-diphosphate-sugar epimerase